MKIRLLLASLAFITASLLMYGCGTATVPEASPNNPLEACPESPNCVRSTLTFMQTADKVLEASEQTLRDMGAESVSQENGGLHAVFRIAVFGFRDDMHVAVHSGAIEEGTQVHIRSASRTGYSDLGVNARRADHFYRLLSGKLQP